MREFRTSSSSVPTRSQSSYSVSSLCTSLKQRMVLSSHTDTSHMLASSPAQAQGAGGDSKISYFVTARTCSILLQDDSGTTAEVLIPNEFAENWKTALLEGEGKRISITNLQVVRREVVTSDSPIATVLTSLDSCSHVVLTVLRNTTYEFLRPSTVYDVTAPAPTSYEPSALCDVKSVLYEPHDSGSRLDIVGKIVNSDQPMNLGSLLRSAICTINIIDGSVDPKTGVNNVGVFLRGSQLTSLVASHVLDAGTVVRVKNVIYSANTPSLLAADNYTTFEIVNPPQQPTKSEPKNQKGKRPADKDTVAVQHLGPTSLATFVLQGELCSARKIPYLESQYGQVFSSETNFAEISPDNVAQIRKQFRHCLVYLRGSVTKKIDDIHYKGCSSCFRDLSPPSINISSFQDGENKEEWYFCTECAEVTKSVKCRIGILGVNIGNGIEAQLKIRQDQLQKLLETMPVQSAKKKSNTVTAMSDGVYNELLTHTLCVPCKCFDGQTFTCANVKDATMYLL